MIERRQLRAGRQAHANRKKPAASDNGREENQIMTKYIGSMIAILLAFTPLSFAQIPKARQAEKAKSTIEEKLIAEEKRVVWEAVVKKEIKVLQDFFANEFLDVSDVGVFTKSETIKLIP